MADMTRTSTLVAALMVTVGAVLLAQQQPTDADQTPVFRAGTDVVQVDVSVLDRRRRPIGNLTAADFTVFENGQPRPVVSFTEVTLPPADAPALIRPDTDVATNAIGNQEGRLVIVLLDRSILPGWPWASAKRVATTTIEQLGPNDLGAVVTWNGATQNLTTDRTLLLRTIDRADPSGVISADAQAIEDRVHQIQGRAMFSSLGDGRCMCGVCGLESIRSVADAVADVPSRRKLLLFVGSNLLLQDAPTDNATQGCGFSLKQSREAAFAALERSNLTVHSFDPTGLEPPPLMSNGFASARLAMMSRQDNLRVLPDRTGGRAVVNTNGPEDLVYRVFTESETYYLLGFEPAPSTSDDERKARKIDVRVSTPGARVHARRQYQLPRTDATVDVTASRAESLARALHGLLPSAPVPMDLHVASFAATGSARAVVTISADVAALAPDTLAGKGEVVAPLELVAGAYDRRGRPIASSRQRLELSWPALQGGARRPRVEALSALELDPGDYEIRVAAVGADPGHAASVFTHLTVPAYATDSLSLSNIVVGAGERTNAVPRDFLAGALPVVPTAQRALARNSDTIAFVQIYQGTMQRQALRPVTARVRILDENDRVVREQSVVFNEREFQPARTANARLTLPVRNLTPGDYVLELQASSDTGRAERRVRFEVRQDSPSSVR